MAKDYSKLRPYDLATAKVGDEVLTDKPGESAIVGIVTPKTVALHWQNDEIIVFHRNEGDHTLKLPPLAWHQDGTPIYAGDSLWIVDKGLSSYGKEYVAEGVENGYLLFTNGEDTILIEDTTRYSHWGHTNPVRTIRTGEFDVPEPERDPLEVGQTYYTLMFSSGLPVIDYNWVGDTTDFRFLDRGLVHLTKEAAELHAKALLSFTTKE